MNNVTTREVDGTVTCSIPRERDHHTPTGVQPTRRGLRCQSMLGCHWSVSSLASGDFRG